ncbi:MAG: Cbb3-type cytochrome oxidase component FixQ [Alphaproteobacteria bacterium]|jgi:cbb3-type cytochrome oxidase subunit 3|nr:Cbb3-type cytochrome oxidase component FixQ [Alphaproteobacteria bacterium]
MIDFVITHASSIALLGFFTGFLFIVATVMRPSRKAELQKHAMIPFEENE